MPKSSTRPSRPPRSAPVERPAARASSHGSGASLAGGIARLADPKISLASFASIFLGACAAWAVSGELHAGWLALTVLGIFALEVAKNASGEVFDWDSGVDRAVAPEDRSPFSGGKRVLVDGLLSRRQTQRVAGVSYLVGIAVGLAIVVAREPGVLWLGLVGVSAAFFYHAPPFRLAYRGLGEPVVALVYGPLIAAGTYLVQVGRVDREIVLAAVPLGLLVGAFLWINEFPDFRADGACGKRNLVVRLGRRAASRAFALLVSGAFVLLSVLPLAGLPIGVLFGWIGAVPAFRAVRRLLQNPEEVVRIVPAQAQTLLAFVLYALGAGCGWLVR